MPTTLEKYEAPLALAEKLDQERERFYIHSIVYEVVACLCTVIILAVFAILWICEMPELLYISVSMFGLLTCGILTQAAMGARKKMKNRERRALSIVAVVRETCHPEFPMERLALQARLEGFGIKAESEPESEPES